MKRVARYMFIVSIVLLSMALAACAGLERYELQRTVEGNLLTSDFPELKLKVDPELSYIGNAEHSEQGAKANPNDRDIQDCTLSYLFGQGGPQGKLSKGVLVRLTVVRGDPGKARSDKSLKGMDIPLDSGVVKILNDEYEYTFRVRNDLFTQEEAETFTSVSMAPCYLVKFLERKAGLGNKSSVQIYYFEDMSSACPGAPCDTCLRGSVDDLIGRHVIRDFDERSYRAMSFMEPKKIVDVTTRYVRPEDKDAISVQAAPQGGKGDGHSGSIEERLKVLKDLLDKNLITREDYEKKKTEILEGL